MPENICRLKKDGAPPKVEIHARTCFRVVFLMIAALVVFVFPSRLVTAQTQPASPPTGISLPKPASLDDDVVAIYAKREQLARQYKRVDRELAEFESERRNLPPDLSRFREFVADIKKEVESSSRRLEAAKKSGNSAAVSRFEQELGFAQNRLSSAERDLNRITELDAKIKVGASLVLGEPVSGFARSGAANPHVDD